MLRLEPRPQPSKTMLFATPLLAVALTLAAGVLLFTALGFDPIKALTAFFITPLLGTFGLAELVVKATPLVLCGIGLAIGFRANVWNIGAEGQIVMGAIAGGGVALFLRGDGGPWVLPAMFIAGALGGMAWAAIPAFLKTRFEASEILTSLMLTYVAQLLLNFLVHGPWRDPDGFNFPQSKMFEADCLVTPLIAGTRVGVGSVLALLAVLAGWVLLARTFLGFQIKVVGLTSAAAGYAGFNRAKVTWLVLLLSGGLAGLAGLNEVAGPIGQLIPTISPGYGFTAIIVAFLGRLHPVGILLASLLIALSYLGGDAAQISMGLPVAVTGVFQGMLLFFLLACEMLVRYSIRWGRTLPEEA
jgi:simple sugar transport system permease protein